MKRTRKVAPRPARGVKRSRKPAAAAPVTPEVPAQAESAQVAPVVCELVVADMLPVITSAPAGLKLEPSCTLRDSIDMQFQLLAVDFGDSDVLVDGSAVERIDTAGLQMLLSFTKYQADRGKPVRWTAVSPELLRSSQLLGMAGMLGIADTASGGSASGN